MNELITTQPFEIVANNYCRQCGRRRAPTDKFCGECGTDFRGLVEFADSHPDPSDRAVVAPQSTDITATETMLTVDSVLNSRMAVFGIIACLGPLGLPALWFSQRFKKRTKIVATISYLLLTIVLPLAIIWYWLDYSLRPVVEALGS